jgi:uncharacterized protein (DUF952 family)
MKPIYHIAEIREFERAARCGECVPDRFGPDGFIHCSYAHQLKGVAESKFRGKKGLILLQIDRSRVPSAIVDESLVGGELLFPHIYGPLPMTAVTSVREVSVPEHAPFELPCNVDV